MTKFFIYFFLLLTINISGQECEYDEYFSLTAEARQGFNERNYKAAGEALKSAFSKVDFPLGTDLSLALTIARKTKDEDWAERICIQLAKGGIPLEFFDSLKKFSWYNKFYDNYSSYQEYYYANFNFALRQKLLEAKKADHEWNEQYHKWRVRQIEMTEEELVKGYSGRLIQFEEVCTKYGFPSEKAMGYYYDKKQVAQYPTGVLLIHIYQGGVPLYLNELDELVCKGYLTPNYAATLSTIKGFGNGTGIEQEVKARIKKFRAEKK